MADNSAEFQEFGKTQIEAATASSSAFIQNFKAVAEEAAAYSAQSIEKVSTLIEDLRSAKSFESALHIQSEYTKTFFTDFFAYLTKIGELYSNLSKEALKPIEAVVAKVQSGKDEQLGPVVAEAQIGKDTELEPVVH
ncbi:MAG: phasin family protein [Methylocella sp.]